MQSFLNSEIKINAYQLTNRYSPEYFTACQKITPVNLVFTGVCFEMLLEKGELRGIETISYTTKYQPFNFLKFVKLPNYHLENVPI